MIKAMRDIMVNPTFANNKDLKMYCRFHEIVVVWSLNKEKVVYVSNVKIHNKDAKPSFF